MKEYGPEVQCDFTGQPATTHRPGNSGPFFCMNCGSTTHPLVAQPEPASPPAPTVYLIHDGNAFAISASEAPSASYLLTTAVLADGTPDAENWGEPMYECLPDELNEALAKVEAALNAVPKVLPSS